MITSHFPRIIWMYWHSGAENMPEECKKCWETYKKYNPLWEIIIVSDNNLLCYLDDYISSNIKKSTLRVSHKSDLIRIALLNKYGGVWADLTSICVDSLEWIQQYKNASILLFSYDTKDDISSWWIACTRNSIISSIFYNEFVTLIEKNNWKYISEYFVFHELFKKLCRTNPIFLEEYNKSPILSSKRAHILQKDLNSSLNTEFIKNVNNLDNHIYKLKGRSQGSINIHGNTNAAYLFDYLLTGNTEWGDIIIKQNNYMIVSILILILILIIIIFSTLP